MEVSRIIWLFNIGNNIIFYILAIPISFVLSRVIYPFGFSRSIKQDIKQFIVIEKQNREIEKKRKELKESERKAQEEMDRREEGIFQESVNFLNSIQNDINKMFYNDIFTDYAKNKRVLLYSTLLISILRDTLLRKVSFGYTLEGNKFSFNNEYHCEYRREWGIYPLDYFYEEGRLYIGFVNTQIKKKYTTIQEVMNLLQSQYSKSIEWLAKMSELINESSVLDFEIKDLKIHHKDDVLYFSFVEDFQYRIKYFKEPSLDFIVDSFSNLFCTENEGTPVIRSHQWLRNNSFLELSFDLPIGIGISDIQNNKQNIESTIKKNIESIRGDNSYCSIVFEMAKHEVNLDFNEVDFSQKHKISMGLNPTYGDNIYFDYSNEHAGHALVVGMTRSGKSYWSRFFLISVMKHFNSTDISKFIFLNTGPDLSLIYNTKNPFLLCPPAKNDQDRLKLIKKIRKEVQERKNLLEEEGMDTIQSFNELNPNKPIPYWFVVGEEFHEILDDFDFSSRENFERDINFICRQSIKTGIFLIFISQRGVDLMSDLKKNINYSLCFAVHDSNESLFMLDQEGSEKLTNKEALLKINSSHTNDLIKIKSPKLDQSDTKKIIDKLFQLQAKQLTQSIDEFTNDTLAKGVTSKNKEGTDPLKDYMQQVS